jgi:deoxyribose-phosphate aldolase
MVKNLNRYIDHTMLKPDARESDIKKLCNEAKQYQFYAVCVNSSYVSLASRELKDSGIKIASVVGFPLGAVHTEAKIKEAQTAFKEGADEIDMVIHIGALKDGRYDYVFSDIRALVEIAKKHNAIVKVILETCLLTDEEVIKACEISTAGATVHHVKLMKSIVKNDLQVKASGGIRDRKKAIEMIEAGATRIGASASIDICR